MNIYESELFSRLKDYSMHPGGLRLTDRAVRLAGLEGGMAAADIGCGAGATAAFLARQYGLKMVGVEISEQLIGIGLKKGPGLHFIRWDCNTLPFEPDSLDAVLFECSLSVIGYDGNALAECAKALKRDGTLIISDLFSKRKTGRPGELPTVEALEQHLVKTGFTIFTGEDHTPALVTYAAELAGQADSPSDGGCFFGERFTGEFKLSDCCYRLIIAKKTI